MNENLLIGILVGMTGSVLLSVGKGVQKMKVDVLKKGSAMLSPAHRRDFGIWLLGVAMTASASIFYSFSLKFTDKSSIVSSLSGIGLVGLLIFAWLVLKERVGLQELLGAAMVIIGTGLIGYFNQSLAQAQRYNLPQFLWLCGAAVAIFAALSLTAVKFPRVHGFVFGLIAGACIGIAMILADMALVWSSGSIIGQFKGPYVYFAILCSACALTVTQVAFFKATAVVVVPTVNSFTILTPLLFEYFTFNVLLAPLQYAGVALIIAGVITLSTSPKQIFKN